MFLVIHIKTVPPGTVKAYTSFYNTLCCFRLSTLNTNSPFLILLHLLFPYFLPIIFAHSVGEASFCDVGERRKGRFSIKQRGLGSMKGKDDSATKSAKGRRVQFSKDGPYESGISSSSPISLKSVGKGGKGDKVANGGKSSQSKVSQSSELDQKLPENIKCLMDCEAADILQGIQDQMVMLSRDSTIKMPMSFDKGLQYARSTSKYTNAQSVRHVLEPLANNGLNDCETCVIGNVCPESADEVFALLPRLKGKRNVDKEVLKDSLIELAKLRQPM